MSWLQFSSHHGEFEKNKMVADAILPQSNAPLIWSNIEWDSFQYVLTLLGFTRRHLGFPLGFHFRYINLHVSTSWLTTIYFRSHSFADSTLWFQSTVRLWHGICCSQLLVAFCSVPFTGWHWLYGLSLGLAYVLFGYDGHWLWIVHPGQCVHRRWRLYPLPTFLLDPKLATSYAGRVVTRLSASCSLLVSW